MTQDSTFHLNMKDTQRGRIPLQDAIKMGKTEVVAAMLDFSDVHLQDMEGRSVLHDAMYCGDDHIISLVLSKSSEDKICLADEQGMTILHEAINGQRWMPFHSLMTHFSRAAIDSLVLMTDEDGDSPLHRTILLPKFDMAVYLLTHTNVDLLLENSKGKSCLQLLTSCPHQETVQLILQKAHDADDYLVDCPAVSNKDCKDWPILNLELNNEESIAMWKSLLNHADTCDKKQMVEWVSNQENQKLIYEADTSSETWRFLVEEWRLSDSHNFLYFVAQTHNLALVQKVLVCNQGEQQFQTAKYDVLAKLLENRDLDMFALIINWFLGLAGSDERRNYGDLILEKCFSDLVEIGMQDQTEGGRNILQLTASWNLGLAMGALLKKPNASSVVNTKSPVSPLELALKEKCNRSLHCLLGDISVHKEVVKSFFGTVNHGELWHFDDDVIVALYPHMFHGGKDDQERTLLHTALDVDKGSILKLKKAHVVKEILKNILDGSYVNAQDSNDDTALHIAVRTSIDASLIKDLLEKQPHINMTAYNVEGWTALHKAASLQKPEVVDVILSVCCQNDPTKCPSSCLSMTNKKILPLLGVSRTQHYQGVPLVMEKLLLHSHECGTFQVEHLLADKETVSSLVENANEDLFSLLVSKWFVKRSKNFLYLVTKMQQTELLKKVIEDKKASELVASGAAEAMKHAAENLHLDTFEIFLKYSPVDGGDRFKDLIKGCEPSLMIKLLNESASKGCTMIFSRLLGIVDTKVIWDAIKSSLKDSCKSVLNFICEGGDLEIYRKYMKKLDERRSSEQEQEFLLHINAQCNDDGNAALHSASLLTNHAHFSDKVDIILDLIQRGADPSVKNTKRATFLNVSMELKSDIITRINSKEEEWFSTLIKNQDQVSKFIKLGDDVILATILQKFCELTESQTVKHAVHPVDLFPQIYEDKSVLKDSWKLMLQWEVNNHKRSEKEVSKCFKDILPERYDYLVLEQAKEFIEPEFGLAYCAKKIMEDMFIVLFFIALFDVITDTVITVLYAVSWNELLSDFPNATECIGFNNRSSPRNATIACYITAMSPYSPIIYTLIVLSMTIIGEILCVLRNPAAKTYKAISSGYCCEDNPDAQKIRSWLIMFILLILQPFSTFVYSFYIKQFDKFGEMYKSEKKKKSEDADDATNNMEVKDCVRCRHCHNRAKSTHICTFCRQNTNVDTRTKIANDASLLRTISKMVTSSTENSFMPLLQLVFLFSRVIKQFPNNVSVNTEEITEVAVFVGDNWRFIITLVSIILSLISMGIAHTENYFARSGKGQQKTWQRWLVMFLGVIFQMVPRLLALEAFAFGIIGFYFGPDCMVASCLALPMLHIFGCACVFFYLNPVKSWDTLIDSALEGFSSLFFLSVSTNYSSVKSKKTKTTPQQVEEGVPFIISNTLEPKQLFKANWKHHLIYSSIIFVENSVLVSIGASFIVDSSFSALKFVICVMGFQVIGLAFHGLYYLFLHPWTQTTNENVPKLRKAYLCMIGLFILLSMVFVMVNGIVNTNDHGTIIALSVVFFFIAVTVSNFLFLIVYFYDIFTYLRARRALRVYFLLCCCCCC
jgi:ankyrin repeat protein